MLITPIIEQLRSQLTSWGDRIAGAAEFAAIEDKVRLSLPAMYVQLTQDEVVREVSISPTIQQDIADRLVITVILANEDIRGQSAQDQIDGIRKALFASILNWTSEKYKYAFQYVGGRMISMDRARYFHEFEFKQIYRIDETDGLQILLSDFNKFYADWNLKNTDPSVHPDAQTQLDNLAD